MSQQEIGLKPAKTAPELLDMYYFEARAHLLETAAILDRIERGQGGEQALEDPRIKNLLKICDLLKNGKTNRAEQLLTLLSI